MSNDIEYQSRIIRVSFEKDITVFTPYNKALLALEARELKNLFDTACRNNNSKFLFNLSGADYIASEALGIIAACWSWCFDENNGQMAVVLSPDERNEVRNLFDIIGLSRMIGTAMKTSVKDGIQYISDFS